MNPKSLKIISIIAIVFAGIGIVANFVALITCFALIGELSALGIDLFAASELVGVNVMLLLIAGVMALASSVTELIAGINGIGASKTPVKLPACMKVGVITIALVVLSNLLSLISSPDSFNFITFLLNLVIPGLFVANVAKCKTMVG